MPETTYIKAIPSPLAEAMRAEARVFVLGEDVAEGGPYTATAGLAEEFGPERVINTPISEAAITGVAIGAAQSGMRPVLEIMFIDFITLALDQLVNAAAKAHFMSGGQLTVPLVLRTQGGAGYRGGAQHSQSLESWLAHVPGLKVVMPSSPRDAAGLLASAIADPNPVVFIENKTLYFRTGALPQTGAPLPICQAAPLAGGGRGRRGGARHVDLELAGGVPSGSLTFQRRRGVRLRDRRSGIRGLRPRGAPERGPRRRGRAARGGRAGRPARDRDADRVPH